VTLKKVAHIKITGYLRLRISGGKIHVRGEVLYSHLFGAPEKTNKKS
jgi:hypothetical protein